MLNSIAIGLIEIAVIISCLKLFFRIESFNKTNRSQRSHLWLMVLIAQTIVVYVLSFLRLILLSLPYNLSSITSNVFFIITITHTLFILSFPAFLHSILGVSKKRNLPFLVFLILNLVLMLSYNQIHISNNDTIIEISNMLSKLIHITYVLFIMYLISLIVFTKKNRQVAKMAFLVSGILFFHIIYLVYNGFIFKPDLFETEISVYSIIFWISLPRDLYMIIVFYILFYNYKEETVELTEREQEILELMLDRNKSKDIANKLNISLSTVNSHIYKIYKKKGVCSKKQLLELKD